jgi:hypothetical protein
MGFFCSGSLERGERLKRYLAISERLAQLRVEWEVADSHVTVPKQPEAGRRERLKIMEAEISVLRLGQAESRLTQQLLIGLLGTGIGSALTLLAQLVVK